MSSDEPRPSPTPASASAAAQYVMEVLREQIVKGEIPIGSRLVERKISSDLNVSRTPVREALKVLQADGLIEISLHRGAQVLAYSAEEAEDLFEVIALLEGLAAERVAVHMTPSVMARLEDLHARMRTRYDAGDLSGYFDLNTHIHDIVVTEADNPVLIENHRRVMGRASRGRYMAIMNPARWRQAVEEHEVLMAALRDGDAEAAGRIWRTHLRHTGDTVATVLRQAGS